MEPQVTAPHVYVAITAVRAALAKDGIAKDRVNKGQGGFKFRGIDDVYNAASSLLAEHQLCVMPSFSERTQTQRESKDGGALFAVTVRGAFSFVSAIDGSSHTVVTYGEAFDSGDKATNKAMSMAMKNCLLETFTVPTQAENNDADEQTHEVQAYTKAEQEIIAGLNTASAEGSKALKAAWQKLDETMRDRLRGQLAKLKPVAEKNDAEKEKAATKAAA